MKTQELLHKKMQQKKMTKSVLSELVDADARTISMYINGTVTSGLYLTKILEILEITVEEWNRCANVINNNDGRKNKKISK